MFFSDYNSKYLQEFVMAKKRKDNKSHKKNHQKQNPIKNPTNKIIQNASKVPCILYSFIIFLITIIGFIFAVWPRFSIFPATSLDLHKPFETPFYIKNDGFLTLYDIEYTLIAEKVVLNNDITFIDSNMSISNLITKLKANKSSAIFLNKIIFMPSDYVKKAKISIHVTYKPYLLPVTLFDSMRFIMEKNVNGEYVWYEYSGHK